MEDIIQHRDVLDPIVTILENPERAPIYAGFYANLVGFQFSTKIVFAIEFTLLLVMAISMYIFYVRER